VELRLTERGWEKAERKRGGYAHGCEDAPVLGGEVAHSFGVELHCEEAVFREGRGGILLYGGREWVENNMEEHKTKSFEIHVQIRSDR
jgi:hypothetical protein